MGDPPPHGHLAAIANAVVACAASPCGAVDASALRAAFAAVHVPACDADAVAGAVLRAAPPCGTEALVALVNALPESRGACALALALDPASAAACEGRHAHAMRFAVVCRVAEGLTDYALSRVVQAIPAGVCTPGFAERVARADMRALEHFSAAQADRAGARLGGTMHTVLPLGAMREDAVRAALAASCASLEAAWASDRFVALARRVGAACAARGVLPLHFDGTELNQGLTRTAAAAMHGQVVLHGMGRAWAPQRRAPCSARGITRKCLRWIVAYGDARAIRQLGASALRRNGHEGALLLMLRRWGRHCAVTTAKNADGSAAACAYLGLHAAERHAAHTHHVRAFVSSTRWRMGACHTARVLRYVDMPVFTRHPRAVHFARLHSVVLSMPPHRARWMHTALTCMLRVGATRDAASLVVAHVRWRDMEARACYLTREHLCHDYEYV